MKNIAVFASRGGSNLQAIIDSCASGRISARVCVVISNNSDSRALQRARNALIPNHHLSEKTSGDSLAEKMLEVLAFYRTDTIFLAGYMKKIPETVLKAYENRIFNIHPSLLPKFGGRGMYGINVHAAVLAAGETETGITIHRVTAEYDEGDILAQRTVPVLDGDTPETLAARVLEQEHIFLVDFLAEKFRSKETPPQTQPQPQPYKKSFGLYEAVVVASIIIFVVIPAIIIPTTNMRRTREREYLLAREDNVIRQEHQYRLRGAGQVEHEVDIERYRPFRRNNRLVVTREAPTITFTENFPRLDGATAAFPVFAAMAQYLYFGLDAHTAMEYVTVSTTDVAYERLINGEIDIFFGAQPSRQQLEMARRAGVELVMTPVAREAFVFFVHEDNPVESLTVSQIQDIYQRNITNWWDVGGRNERILAFQRPENSGSQTIMLALVMDGLQIAEPVMSEEEAGPMGSMLEYVALNDYRNVSSAIGYSFRYFVREMHPTDGITVLAINGIEPTIENIRNGTYPFIINVYAVTAGSTNENTELLLEWILSDQGQRFIELCGIVSIRG